MNIKTGITAEDIRKAMASLALDTAEAKLASLRVVENPLVPEGWICMRGLTQMALVDPEGNVHVLNTRDILLEPMKWEFTPDPDDERWLRVTCRQDFRVIR